MAGSDCICYPSQLFQSILLTNDDIFKGRTMDKFVRKAESRRDFRIGLYKAGQPYGLGDDFMRIMKVLRRKKLELKTKVTCMTI